MRPVVLCMSALLLTAGFDCNRAEAPRRSPEPTEPEPAEPEPMAPTPNVDDGRDPPRPAAPLVVTSDLASPVNQLGLDIYGQLRQRPGNLAISPASISTALAMTYGGARGETAAQMAKALHFPEDGTALHAASERFISSVGAATNRPYKLNIANRLYGEKTCAFEDPFLALTRDRYSAELERVDFRGDPSGVRSHINSWVAGRTNDRIQDLLPPPSVTGETRLVLVNALYFDGPWQDPFQETLTTPQPFHVSATESAEVPTMHRSAEHLYGEVEGAQILTLPYQGNDLAMTIVLPTARDGVSALEGQLDAARLEAWLEAPSERTLVAVALPRFTVRPGESVDLVEILQGLGMRLAFQAVRADFTGIANPEDPRDRLYITHVLHKAFVEVDEEGTEAAAATAVVMARGGGAPSDPVTFTADHPFLFFIHHRESRAVLFMGRLADPR